MRIFFITHTYSLNPPHGGGSEVFVSNLLKELSQQGHELFVFTTKGRSYSVEEKKFNIKVFHCGGWGHHALYKFQYLLFAKKAVQLAKEFNADIVHSHNSAFPALIGEKVSKQLKIPHVMFIEIISEKNHSLHMKAVYAFEKHFIPKIKADKIISMGQYVVDKFLIPWGLPREKIMVIPTAVDTEKFNPAISGKEIQNEFGKSLIISIKPLHATNAKGISYIIQAMKKVVEAHLDWKYIVFGKGMALPKLQALVQELKLEQNVIFPERIFPYNQTPQVYAAASILPHSFVYEATASMSLLDSMAMGKAIVVSDIGEIKNVVKDSAVLVKPMDGDSFANGLLKLIENPALRKKLGKKARALAVKNHAIKSIAKKFTSIYTELKR